MNMNLNVTELYDKWFGLMKEKPSNKIECLILTLDISLWVLKDFMFDK